MISDPRHIRISDIRVFDTFRSAIAIESVDGAVIDDVVTDLVAGGLCTKAEGPSHIMKQLGKDEIEIYNYVLKYGETSTENLAKALKKSPAELNPIITVLEMKGIIGSGLGKIFIAK